MGTLVGTMVIVVVVWGGCFMCCAGGDKEGMSQFRGRLGSEGLPESSCHGMGASAEMTGETS
jgi:hypothetical protein